MARVSTDAEMMTNLVSALPVPAGSFFRTVLDENRRPLIISLGTGAPTQLQTIRQETDGQNEIVNLRSRLSIPDGAVILKFDVQQAANLKICLCVVISIKNDRQDLILTKPFLPEILRLHSTLPLITGRANVGAIEGIWMAPIVADPSGPDGYPVTYVTHRALDQLTSWGSDITAIHVSADQETWQSSNKMASPENTSGILDIAPAYNSSYGNGIFVLYKSQGKTKLLGTFVTHGEDVSNGDEDLFKTSLQCPPDATCISSYFDYSSGDDGSSGLIIGSKTGLHWLGSDQAIDKDEIPKAISGPENLLNNIKDLEIAQDGPLISAWFRNDKGELGYMRALNSDFDKSRCSMLLPADQATSFAVCVSRPREDNGQISWQMLVCVDAVGNLQLLQQASDSAQWRPTPLYSASSAENIEVNSYTATLKLYDEKGLPLTSGEASISCSSATTVYLNGRYSVLSPNPCWYKADEGGLLNFIIPTASMAAPVMEITELRDEEGRKVAFSSVTLDPCEKAMKKLREKMGSFSSAAEFAKAKTQDDKPLFEDGHDLQDLKAAMDCFGTLNSAYAKAPPNGRSIVVKGVQHVEEVVSQTSEYAGNFLTEAWYWLKSQVSKAVNWCLKAAGDAWEFVCEIAGKVWSFVLDCKEMICEAVSWFWEKIKVGWTAVRDFIGFLFNWEDILETKRSISTLITSTIGAASDLTQEFKDSTEGFFATIEKKLDGIKTGPKVPLKVSQDGVEGKTVPTQEGDFGTGVTWATERLKNGGALSQTVISAFQGPASEIGLGSTFVKAFTGFAEDIGNILQKLPETFIKEGGISGDSIVNLSVDVLISIVKGLKTVVIGMFDVVAKCFDLFSKVGNQEISLPIFSWLYKKVSGGHALTLFDALSLIIAIPTTIVAKIVTGECPPKVPNLDRQLVKKITYEGDTTLDRKTIYAYDLLKAEIALGISVFRGIWNVIEILYLWGNKSLSSGIDGAGGNFGRFIQVGGVIFDLFGTLAAVPAEKGNPGPDYRHAISAISLFRGLVNLGAICVNSDRDSVAKALLVFDMTCSLAQFCLYVPVFDAELKDEEWFNYDETTTYLSMSEGVLNLLAGASYVAAFWFKEKDPRIAAVGVIVMQVGLTGVLVAQVSKLRKSYLDKRTLVFMPPSH